STITVELDGQVRVIKRTTDVPVRNVKANKPREVNRKTHPPQPSSADVAVSVAVKDSGLC
ncbi:hypothetical protein, partial [Streptomyces sp. NPDC051219]|uniref:hypothetical protein n=1 Tax=Streptomyces sp. NPDC051219 TaxID=3155283 RepID=UPI00343BB74E